jgi:hypothetical protein
MKESHDEGVASHIDPESCARAREGSGEALTGVRAGRVLSRNTCPAARAAGGPGCRGCRNKSKATPALPHWRGSAGPRAVRDPAHARKHLARKPGDPASLCLALGSVERTAHREAQGRTTMSHRRGKSDRGVVPKKLPNKAAGEAPAAAEVVEGRPRAKGNAVRARMSRRSTRVYDVSTALKARQTAKGRRDAKFTGLLHHIYAVERLRRRISRSSATRLLASTAKPGSRTGRTSKRPFWICPTGWPAGATGPSL